MLIASLVPYLDSRPIPKSDLLHSAFCSISIQTIRASAVLPERHDDFWTIQYDDSNHSTPIPKC